MDTPIEQKVRVHALHTCMHVTCMKDCSGGAHAGHAHTVKKNVRIIMMYAYTDVRIIMMRAYTDVRIIMMRAYTDVMRLCMHAART